MATMEDRRRARLGKHGKHGKLGALVRGAVLASALACVALPGSARAAEVADVADGAFDLVILRPLNLSAVVVGAGMFALSAPLVFPFEGLSTSYEHFVYYPFEYTFLRGIGDF